VIDGTGKQPDRFTVLLAEPLMDSRGSIAIPASAQLLVQVEGVAATGQVQLSAITAAWQERGRIKEIILPTGAIQVRGKDGQPLIARQFTDKGKEIAALDAGQFLLGAVRRSAELYTRSNTRVENSNSTTVVTQENPPPNILAGALEGGTSAILDTIAERNQRAVEAIQNRPPIHFIKAGSLVQVFVNQSMQLPM
jgi:Bacterial conjugation TrbI-like protein